jgi:hypothetical protein
MLQRVRRADTQILAHPRKDNSGIPHADVRPRTPVPIEKFPGTYQPGYAELFRQAQPIDFGRLSLEVI